MGLKLKAKPKAKAKAKPKTIDAYLAALSADKRVALQKLRKVILAAAPGAEECISYQLPAFRLDGRIFLWMGAGANHCALYGVSGAHKDELKKYDTSGKGTVRFEAANPLPATLIRKVVKAQIARNAAKRTARSR